MIDALKAGYRLGFVGGGDIHDGRPGDALEHVLPKFAGETYPQGLTAAFVPALTREAVFDAMATRQTYATTHSRIYLDVQCGDDPRRLRLLVRAASEDGLARAVCVRNGSDMLVIKPDGDPRIITEAVAIEPLEPGEFCYVRVENGWRGIWRGRARYIHSNSERHALF